MSKTEDNNETVSRKFADIELAHLTAHLLNNVKVNDLLEQQAFNEAFRVLQLNRFEQNRIDLTRVSNELQTYELTRPLSNFLAVVISQPMAGKTARIIGCGTTFFLRLVKPPETEPVAEEADLTKPPELGDAEAASSDASDTPQSD